MTPQERYTWLVKDFVGRPRVTQEGRGFGASGLRVGGSIFAMLSSRGAFVVKLPAGRVDQMIASGEGERFETGRGRQMREWLALRGASGLDWRALAEEAMEFVASRPARPPARAAHASKRPQR
ncbi:MAG: hypothetical protein ACREPI_12090 [Candidatus Dormibacterales bacterium]